MLRDILRGFAFFIASIFQFAFQNLQLFSAICLIPPLLFVGAMFAAFALGYNDQTTYLLYGLYAVYFCFVLFLLFRAKQLHNLKHIGDEAEAEILYYIKDEQRTFGDVLLKYFLYKLSSEFTLKYSYFVSGTEYLVTYPSFKKNDVDVVAGDKFTIIFDPRRPNIHMIKEGALYCLMSDQNSKTQGAN